MRLKQVLASTTLAATVLTGTAFAADVGPAAGNTTYSREGVALVASPATVLLPTTNIHLLAEYAEQDVARFTVVGPALASATAPTMVCSDPALQWGFLGRVGNEITFRITQVNTGVTTIGVDCVLGGLRASGANVSAANSVVVNYAAFTGVGNLPLDTGCTGANCVANSGTIATVRNQFAAVTVTPFNQVVDVNASRYEFETGTDDAFTFQQWTDNNVNALTPPNPADAAVFTNPAAITDAVVVLQGDFSWVDSSGNGSCSAAEYQAAVTIDVGAFVSGTTACTAVTFAQTTAEGNRTITLTPLAASEELVLPAQTWTAVVTLSYDNGASPDIAVPFTLNAGAWTLNGFQAFIGYMPFGPNISLIVYAANSSSQSGDITIDGYNLAGESCTFAAGTMPSNSTMALSGAIRAGFEACYGAGFEDRVAFNVIINIPASAGDIYSAYNVGGVDRGTVVNSANGK